MSFRNAVKILLSRFGLVWTILLYTVIFVFVLACLSVTFVVPVVRALDAAGVGDSLSALFNSVLSGDSMQSWFEQIKAIVDTAGTTIRSDFSARLNTWLAVVVFVLAGRFLVGLYELPARLRAGIVHVLPDAKVGFTGRFISRLGVLLPVHAGQDDLHHFLFDAVLYAILYAMFGLFSVRGFGLLAAPLIMLTFIALNAFRYAVISMVGAVGHRGRQKDLSGVFLRREERVPPLRVDLLVVCRQLGAHRGAQSAGRAVHVRGGASHHRADFHDVSVHTRHDGLLRQERPPVLRRFLHRVSPRRRQLNARLRKR